MSLYTGEYNSFLTFTGRSLKLMFRVRLHVLDFCRMYIAEYEQGFSLREMGNGDCCMLREGKCRIYAARPLQCRTWPFWPSNVSSPRAWQDAGRRCPGIGKGRTWSEAEITRQKEKMRV